MSKSKGNHIPLLTDGLDMFGKVMSIPDDAMELYFRLLLGWSREATNALNADIQSGEKHPRDVKAGLAREILTIYHPESDPAAIQREWEGIFKEQGVPDDMDEFAITEETKVVDILAETGMTQSKKEARRQIENGGVRVEGDKIEDINATLTPDAVPVVLQVGKRKFVKVVAG
jgi:tyrosyl-tRNA synthetase